jgi:hypothetical protein
MGENLALGWAFGMYTTYMNGIISNYFKKPSDYNTTLETRQAKSEAGSLLFFDKDGNITETDTGIPVLENVPVITQGITQITEFDDYIGAYCGDIFFKIPKENKIDFVFVAHP